MGVGEIVFAAEGVHVQLCLSATLQLEIRLRRHQILLQTPHKLFSKQAELHRQQAGRGIGVGHQHFLQEFKGVSYEEEVKPKIQTIVIETLLSVKPVIEQKSQCFELYGFYI